MCWVATLTRLSRLELYGWDRTVQMGDDELPLLLPLQRLRVLHLRPVQHCSTDGLPGAAAAVPAVVGFGLSREVAAQGY